MKATATWIVRTCSRVSRCQHFRRGSVLNKTDRKSLRNLCGFKPGQDVTDRRKANSTQHLFNTNLRDVLFQYVPFSEVWIFLTLTVATNIKTYFSTALRPVFGSWHPPPPPRCRGFETIEILRGEKISPKTQPPTWRAKESIPTEKITCYMIHLSV